ncbi:hypothetical protein PEC18_33965 [Paucibacter sp. O1-1]|nr:hypothetical protein [Paucibacter sp. O1-1]MDA3830699.1 hypothetical protein [Paucibacter sp. O1-1]
MAELLVWRQTGLGRALEIILSARDFTDEAEAYGTINKALDLAAKLALCRCISTTHCSIFPAESINACKTSRL